jgi:hypothetical protein
MIEVGTIPAEISRVRVRRTRTDEERAATMDVRYLLMIPPVLAAVLILVV